MPLECICATSASSWSFTDSSLSFEYAVERFLFTVFGRCLAQSGYTLTELLPQGGRREPACSATRQLEVTCHLRSSQLRGIGSKRGEGHHSHRNDDHTSHQSKSPPENPVDPTQPNCIDCPADDPGNDSCHKNDREKNCQKPSQIGNCGRLHVGQVPGSNVSISPSRQQKTKYSSGQRKNFKEKTMRCGQPNRNQHRAQDGPIQSIHAGPTTSLSRQFASCQNPVCLYVLLTRLVSNIIWQGRRRRLFVPPDRLQIITNKLFVKRFLRLAGPIFVRRPEAR